MCFRALSLYQILLKIVREIFGRGPMSAGVFMLDRKTNMAKRFTEDDGLLYDGALGLNEDNANSLWITSARGISILNLLTNKISHLATDNGLPEDARE